jgi:hypothetical protein
MWPGVVTVDRRFKRPQHVIRYAWRHFDTPLILRPDLPPIPEGNDEYGLKLVQHGPIKSTSLRARLAPYLTKVPDGD